RSFGRPRRRSRRRLTFVTRLSHSFHPDLAMGAHIARVRLAALRQEPAPALKMRSNSLTIRYGAKEAIKDVSLDVNENEVLALIGPSGCGKSTFLRALNRMNDTIEGASTDGSVELDGQDIYAADVDAVMVRRRVGMVFQKSNPFPKSIFEN